MKRKLHSVERISQRALISLICDKILHDSARLSSCEIRYMLYDAIELNK